MTFEIGNTEPYNSKQYDCLLYSDETGFSPLPIVLEKCGLKSNGMLKKLLHDVGEKSLVLGIRFKKPVDHLKGLIIAPGERSQAHQKFVRDNYSRPYKDFFYAMHYLSYELAENFLGASCLGVTHLTGGGKMPYYSDVAKCATEAFVHFKSKNPESRLEMSFTGCCLKEDHFKGLDDFARSIKQEESEPVNFDEEEFSDEMLEIKVYKAIANRLVQ